jgi:hypothetical protein
MKTEIEKQYDELRHEFDITIYAIMRLLDKSRYEENQIQRLLGEAHYIHRKLNELYEQIQRMR